MTPDTEARSKFFVHLLLVLVLAGCSDSEVAGAPDATGSGASADGGTDARPPGWRSGPGVSDAGARRDGALSPTPSDAHEATNASEDASAGLDAGAVRPASTDAARLPDADSTAPSAPDASCAVGERCGCAVGYESNGQGGCRNVDDCVDNACQHGSPCVDGLRAYTCDCTGTGYQGARCDAAISNCPTPALCASAAYSCALTTAPHYTCLGQFADWPMPDRVAGAAHAPDYDLTTAFVVVDKVTGLMWQKELPTTYGGCTKAANSCTWDEARNYCDGLVLNSHADWRLPSKIELESIVDETRYNPVVDMAVFPAPRAPNGYANFWTSSPYDGSSAYAVDFVDGWSIAIGEGTGNHVRCVRGISTQSIDPDQRYQVDIGTDTVADTITGLVWQRAVSATPHTQSDAKAYCTGSFRLPTLKELLTLIDPTRKSPALSPTFPNKDPASNWFWTSSPDNRSASYAWAVYFDDGSTTTYKVSSGYYVRCVK